jgi:hypothetical protein
MSAGDFLIVLALLIGVFWVVGKLFLKALKFILITALGAAILATIFLGPIYLIYVALIGVYGFFHVSRPAQRRVAGPDNDAPVTTEES